MKPWTLPNLNGRKPLPASGPFWASAASMNETGLGRPKAAPAHAAVNRALRRRAVNSAIFPLLSPHPASAAAAWDEHAWAARAGLIPWDARVLTVPPPAAPAAAAPT